MKSSVRVLPVLIVVALLVTACGGSRVRVGVQASNPPFEHKVKGNLTGFDVALMEAIAEEAGFAIKWVDLTWGEFSTALAEGDVDVTLAGATLPVQVAEGITVTTEVISDVLAVADLSDPFFVAEERFYRTSGEGNVDRIGYWRGSLAFTADEGIPSSLVFVGYPTLAEAFAALQDGTVDAVHAGEYQVAYHLPQAPATYPSLNARYSQYVMSTAKDSGLVETIDAALQSIIDDGTYAELYGRWFSDEVPYAYWPLSQRDEAVVEQSQTLLEMGSVISGGIIECLRTSDSAGCLHDVGQAAVGQMETMDIQPALRPLQDALLGVARACRDMDASGVDALAAAISDYQAIASRVAATFVR
jgi:ABC-type amino acid transport substrate-binding protein